MMTVVRYLLLFIEIVTSLLLIAVILMQRSKGQGLGMAFGAGMGESLFGSQMGNVLTKTTVVLAIVFLANTTLLAILGASRENASASVADKIPVAAPVAPSQPTAGQPGEMPEPQAAPLPVPGEAAMPEPVEIPAGPAPADSMPEPVEIPATQPEPVPVE